MGIVLIVLLILFLVFQRRIEDWLRPFANWMHEYAPHLPYTCMYAYLLIPSLSSQHARGMAHPHRAHVPPVLPSCKCSPSLNPDSDGGRENLAVAHLALGTSFSSSDMRSSPSSAATSGACGSDSGSWRRGPSSASSEASCKSCAVFFPSR